MTQNHQIRESVVKTIFIDMMYYKFSSFSFALKTFVRKIIQGFNSICINSMFKFGTERSFLRYLVTTISRTKFLSIFSFFRGFKCKSLIAKLTYFSNAISSFGVFVTTSFRTTNNFCFLNPMFRDIKAFITNRTSQGYTFLFKIICTCFVAKEVFRKPKFIGLNMNRFFTKRTLALHSHNDCTQEVLCLQ